jgi:hypothetical protein
MSEGTLLLIHAAATAAMVGLIWTVQLVVYPLFRTIGPEEFAVAHALHTKRVSVVLALFAPLEVLSAVALVLQGPEGVSDLLLWSGLALLAIVWGLTLILSVPAHTALGAGQDLEIINRLIRTNWPRTIAWTSRGVVAFVMLERFAG